MKKDSEKRTIPKFIVFCIICVSISAFTIAVQQIRIDDLKSQYNQQQVQYDATLEDFFPLGNETIQIVSEEHIISFYHNCTRDRWLDWYESLPSGMYGHMLHFLDIFEKFGDRSIIHYKILSYNDSIFDSPNWKNISYDQANETIHIFGNASMLDVSSAIIKNQWEIGHFLSDIVVGER